MHITFENKTVVVTGGTRGIGAAMVEAFLESGAKVYATGTDFQVLNELNESEKLKSKPIEYLYLDFTSPDSVNDCLEILSKLDRIDVLVNNAGVNKIDTIDEIMDEDWDWINTVNLRGPFVVTKALAKKMKEQKSGKVVSVSSIFGVVSKEKRAAYSTTKWGLIGLTKAIALDLAPYNILANAVSPGFVDTELTRRVLGDKGIDELVGRIP
ncbi:MAG: SDR family oxidoreductase, partial [Candidatus Scalindua sp.]|nr:SDR family oxidoreductase [Candidatus Scalindua sp.]